MQGLMDRVDRIKAFLDFLANNGPVDWVSIPDEYDDLIIDLIWKGLVQSYVETQTYDITDIGKMILFALTVSSQQLEAPNS